MGHVFATFPKRRKAHKLFLGSRNGGFRAGIEKFMSKKFIALVCPLDPIDSSRFGPFVVISGGKSVSFLIFEAIFGEFLPTLHHGLRFSPIFFAV